MNNTKTPQEAARLASERAKQAAEGQTKKKARQPSSFTSAEILDALEKNEAGDAMLLIKAMKDRFVFDVKRQMFFRFEGGHWKKDLEKETLAFAGRTLQKAFSDEATRQLNIFLDPKEGEDAKKAAKRRYDSLKRRLDRINTLSRRKSVLELAATGLDGLAISGDEWNADPWKLQAGAMLIDLRTGEARPGVPSDYVNKATPTEWKGIDEPSEAWENFFTEIFDGNPDLIAYMNRVLGSALVGKPSQQEFYILWGEGRNGKGTMLETLKDVLGDAIASAIRSEMVMESRQNTGNADPELLELQGKRLVWTSETGDGKKLNAEKVKLFTGGDTLSSRYNYSNEIISFKPSHTLFMLTNHRPRIAAGDTAIWDRLRLIPFGVRFVDEPQASNERKKNPDLPEDLKQQASGILSWLVRGCIRWQQEGMNPPNIVLESCEEYRLDEDLIGQFVKEKCILGTGYQAQAKPLYDSFSEWFSESFGEKAHVPSLKKFSDRLKNMPGIVREKGRHTIFRGLRLLEDGELPLESHQTNMAAAVEDCSDEVFF